MIEPFYISDWSVFELFYNPDWWVVEPFYNRDWWLVEFTFYKSRFASGWNKTCVSKCYSYVIMCIVVFSVYQCYVLCYFSFFVFFQCYSALCCSFSVFPSVTQFYVLVFLFPTVTRFCFVVSRCFPFKWKSLKLFSLSQSLSILSTSFVALVSNKKKVTSC